MSILIAALLFLLCLAGLLACLGALADALEDSRRG